MTIPISLILISFCVQLIDSTREPIVELPDGYVLGRQTRTLQNTTYYTFEGIPYAAPPVGKLRFKAPQPPANWSDVLNTTHFHTACYQISSHDFPEESEDCLYLSVHTPTLPGFEEELLPVMVFIHGGAFILGTGHIFTPDLFVDNGVVFVTMNYRLGVFGFLSTQDEVIPGNNGLKDQLLALKWINRNIFLFGGNASRVTIFGESAGSASVAYHLLNQNSAGLFSGAIMQSGSFLSPWALERYATDTTYATVALLEPKVNQSVDSQSLLEILQNVDASDLNDAAERYYNLSEHPWMNVVLEEPIWGPVIEVKNPDAFLTKRMYDLLRAGNILQVPIIIGFNSEECIAQFQDPHDVQSILSSLDRNLNWVAPDDMQIAHFDDRVEMGRKIRSIYTKGGSFLDNVGAGVRYASDNSFTRPTIRLAELFSDFADTYFYQFSYDGEMGGLNVTYEGAEGVGHAEDIFYLFCYPTCDASDFPESDAVTRARLVKLWTNFAKYRNPTPDEFDDVLQNVTWPKVSTESGDFLYLDIGDDLVVKNHPKEDTYKQWISLYDSLDAEHFDTY